MRVVQAAQIGERRVRWVITADGSSAVTIEVLGPEVWEDISLRADSRLRSAEAERRYQQRVDEQWQRMGR